MLHYSNTFLDAIEIPADGTRPDRSGGVAYTLGASDSEGSYTQFLDGSTDWSSGFGDGFGILIELADSSVSNQVGNALATIGIDLAGGTSYTEWIHDLVAGPVSSITVGNYAYFFPIIIPNGASLAIKGQSSNASPPASSRVRCQIFGKPTRPELMRFGTFVQTFGADTANSRGTVITEGTTSEGSYAELGTLDKPIWGWEYGWSSHSSSMSSNLSDTDIAIGDASSKRRVITNNRVWTSTAEAIGKRTAFSYGEGYSGEKVYGRVQTGDNAANGSVSLIAYGVGG